MKVEHNKEIKVCKGCRKPISEKEMIVKLKDIRIKKSSYIYYHAACWILGK